MLVCIPQIKFYKFPNTPCFTEIIFCLLPCTPYQLWCCATRSLHSDPCHLATDVHECVSSGGGSACSSSGGGGGGHHRVDTLWEELRWLTVHRHLLICVCNLYECGLIEGASPNL